ncbi:hypothetical protein LCGC14_1856140 [marine sediment metagenome]|uniref:Uncharacterized protein n=1 Tax=marine sediment metagenome TaxID=412755 RepID=A0A0F9INE3_9ZZZZ
MTTYEDEFNVFTYQDYLIFYKIENFDWWIHRDIRVKKDFFLKRYINGLDVLIFEEKPIFVPDILETNKDMKSPDNDNIELAEPLEGDELTPFYDDVNILKDWNKENWDDLLIGLYDAARTHKWCIPVLYDEPPYWQIFTYREISEIEYNKNDIPVKAHAVWAKQLPLSTKFNQHDIWINLVEENTEKLNKDGGNTGMGIYVNWGHDMDKDIDGNDLESIWSLDIDLGYILNDILSNSAKSSGFYHVMYGGAITPTLRNDIQDSFENCGTNHMIGATEQTIKQIIAMFPAKPEFSIEAMDKVMKIFAGATGLPFLFFNSEKDTGSIFEENSSAMIQVNAKKREIFSKLKYYVLKLVEMRWGIVCDDVFPNIPEVKKEEDYKEFIIESRVSDNKNNKKPELIKNTRN